MNKTIIIFIIIIVVSGGMFLLRRGEFSAPASGMPVSRSPGFQRGLQPNDHIIKMTSDGFSPEAITIKKGETVTWVNEDKDFHWPASNLHPTHLIYPEFDPREPVAPGETWSFQFDRIGKWRLHDHLRPRYTGTVEVTE